MFSGCPSICASSCTPGQWHCSSGFPSTSGFFAFLLFFFGTSLFMQQWQVGLTYPSLPVTWTWVEPAADMSETMTITSPFHNRVNNGSQVGHGWKCIDPWPIWPIQKTDPFDPWPTDPHKTDPYPIIYAWPMTHQIKNATTHFIKTIKNA